MPDYLNFELQIVDLDGEAFLASVLDAPRHYGDPPHHTFNRPFDERTLRRYLLVLSGERRPRGMSRLEAATQFGEKLFTTVFAGEVYDAYQESRQLAKAQQKWLRIRLNLNKAGELASLPWEFLRDPQIDFLTLSRSTPIVRYPKQLVNPTRYKTNLPLRILVMISAPDGLPKVDEATERRNLERALLRLKSRELVEVDYLEDASLRNLQRTLRQKEYHAFHYIGHGVFDYERNEGYLALEADGDFSRADLVRGEALARELQEEDTLRLVVLNTCQGAIYDARDPFSGVASSLVKRGLPAVVAQQFEITDKAAIAFSEEFYRAVAEGFSVEAAVSEGRRAIMSVLDDSIEWGTPVLFLHQDGELFGFPKKDVQRDWWGQLARFSPFPTVLVILFAVVLLLILGSIAGYALIGSQGQVAAAPPTATPIPDVDLVVSDMRISPQIPRPGELVAVFVDIQNRGSDPSPPFVYEWQSSVLDADTTQRFRVEGLAPGGILHASFTARFGWWGVFITETRLDVGNEIIEPDERNSRPSPVRADSNAKFVIDLSNALPDGSFIDQAQPAPADAFAAWGFSLEARSDDPACGDIVPWFKLTEYGSPALGTGSRDDPADCADGELILLFDPIRSDGNPAGVSAVKVDFAAGAGRRTVQAFGNVQGTSVLDFDTQFNSRRAGLSITVARDFMTFAKILRVEIGALDEASLLVTRLELSAP